MYEMRFLDHPRAWLGWIVANAIGYAVGFALWQAAFPVIRPALGALLGGTLLVAGFGATVGLCAGLAQAAILRRGLALAGAWLLASVVGAAVGFAVGAEITALMNAALEPQVGIPLTDAALVLTFGAVIGVGMGLAQWLILRAQGIPGRRWILASAVGLLIGYPLAIGALELLPELDQPWVGLVFGACAGATAALLQWLITRRRGDRTYRRDREEVVR